MSGQFKARHSLRGLPDEKPDDGDMKKKIIRAFRLARGRWRLAWELCPACNSDAPKTDICRVCYNYRHKGHNPPSKQAKQAWWRIYRSMT